MNLLQKRKNILKLIYILNYFDHIFSNIHLYNLKKSLKIITYKHELLYKCKKWNQQRILILKSSLKNNACTTNCKMKLSYTILLLM